MTNGAHAAPAERHERGTAAWGEGVEVTHQAVRAPGFESEGWKIKFGQAHFHAIGVDYAFGDAPKALIVPTATEG
ncbi:MAG: hypothetical protein H0T97_05185 [Actinobacteria bacterium]|nr:hypothetical protein [Actinomycetota bacterium]